RRQRRAFNAECRRRDRRTRTRLQCDLGSLENPGNLRSFTRYTDDERTAGNLVCRAKYLSRNGQTGNSNNNEQYSSHHLFTQTRTVYHHWRSVKANSELPAATAMYCFPFTE